MIITPIDVLIRGARVVDGTGNPWFYGDVALGADRIVAVTPPGRLATEGVREVVEAAGLVVCPGFIDLLSHSHLPLMHDSRALSKLTQGVTTEIMGEGWTPAPFGGRIKDPFLDLPPKERGLIGEWAERAKSWTRWRDWLDAMVERGISPNIGSFLGGGTLREYAKGRDMGAPTPEELETMRRVMAETMEEGAFGVSYALIYPPDTYTSTAELAEVARVVSRYGGIYVSHLRSEGDALLEAIDEALEIGRQAEVPVEIYHLKALGKHNWHKMPDAIARIQQARAAGVDVTADMYPYAAAGTGLDSVLPPWVAEGGQYFERLADPAIQERVKAEALAPAGGWEALARGIGPEGIIPVGFEQPENMQYAGKPLSEIADMRKQHWLDATIDLLLSERQRIGTIYLGMDEANVTLGLKQPWVTISTDAGGVDPVWAQELGPTHPREYGTYPRVLAKYVRQEQVLTLEEAIRKMSGAAAARLGLRERGLLRPGCFADVVLFDPGTVADRATFTDPHQISTGIRDVWVNGTRVIKAGQHTGATPGRVVTGATG
ncbi:MAG TPA: D-aminoacylase [Ktedonobacterales bacterium]|jgi:N-acyl-D-aspartate/D-glutamate deacylase